VGQGKENLSPYMVELCLMVGSNFFGLILKFKSELEPVELSSLMTTSSGLGLALKINPK
jgi:hypothetical protein